MLLTPMRPRDPGAELVAEPVLTPWWSVDSRLDAPAGLQITLFQETAARRPGPQSP